MMGKFKENVLKRGTAYDPAKDAPKPKPKPAPKPKAAAAGYSEAPPTGTRKVTAKAMTPELEALFDGCPFPIKEKVKTGFEDKSEVTVVRIDDPDGVHVKLEVSIKQGCSTSIWKGSWGGG